MNTRPIQSGNARVVVRREMVGDDLRLRAFSRKFPTAAPPDADDDTRELFTTRWNFIYAMSKTIEIVGLNVPLLDRTASADDIESAFQLFLEEVDAEFADDWLLEAVAVQEAINKPSDDADAGDSASKNATRRAPKKRSESAPK